jgi:hypothetical protein
LLNSTSSNLNASDGDPPNSRRSLILLVTLVCLAVWGAFLPSMLTHNTWIYSSDSAAYIETALSINAGRGFVHRAILGLNPNIWEPIRFWPPGYPILIALAQLSGMPPTTAGLVVSLVSSGIFVILLTKICLRLFHWSLALSVTLAAVCMPAFLYASTSALSDTTYLAFAAASIYCLLLWSSRRTGSWMWLTAAGLLAGISWGIRNTALSLFIATAIFILCHFLWWRFQDVIRIIIMWLTGVMLGCGPFLIRNLLTFGRIIPWNDPASGDLSFWEIIYPTFHAIIRDLTASKFLTNLIVNKYSIIIYIFAIAVVIWFYIRNISLSQLSDTLRSHRYHILFVSYLLIYISVLIVARMKYFLSDFPGGAESRHFVQIYWIIWIYFAILLRVFFQQCRLTNKTIAIVLSLVVFIIAGQQMRKQLLWLQIPIQERSMDSIYGEKAVTYLKSEINNEQIVLSMENHLLRLFLGLNARNIPTKEQCPYWKCFTREDFRESGESGVLWGMVIDDVKGTSLGYYGVLMKDILERSENYQEFERVKIESPAVIFKYIKGRLPLLLLENEPSGTP